VTRRARRPTEQANQEVPYEVARQVDRLLSKRVADRPESAEQAELECRNLLAWIQTDNDSRSTSAKANRKRDLTVRELRDLRTQYESLEAEASERSISLEKSSNTIKQLRTQLRSANRMHHEDRFWQDAASSLEVLRRLNPDSRGPNQAP